jgi:4-hydroxybenzoate polyprenyltransferase
MVDADDRNLAGRRFTRKKMRFYALIVILAGIALAIYLGIWTWIVFF